MKIGTITTSMTLFETADALWLTPDAHPDAWHKRLTELRRQDRSDEATIVEQRFPGYLSAAASAAHNRTTDMIVAWANSVKEDT